ncbi:uncharacterized protein FOMMEDRAFT_80996, partial [Fomitiporia mediterranea MF3/22]|uniref:uncharacterized protein n=1 Tax=Fomitiporia mediterranea (strain MF3/22) TaxID=694068 RepID=UPI000440937D
FLQFRIQWASIALLYYDYALTFPAEVKYIWGKKFRISTFLYICCRYALIANVLFLAAIANKIPNITRVSICVFICDAWYKFDGAISVLGRVAVVATITGRTYAVYGCSRLVLVVLGSLGLTCIILDIVRKSHMRTDFCDTDAEKMHVPEAGLLAILMCVFEFLAVTLTVVRCIQECRVGGSWKFERGGFFTLVSQQGFSYYCIVSVFTTTAVILTFRGSFFQRIPNAMNLPVSCLLTARFLLQLREWQSRDTVNAETSANLEFGTQSNEHVQTLSVLRAVAVVDDAILDDFGGYEPSADFSWETESTRAYGAEMSPDSENGIVLDNLLSSSGNTVEKDCSGKV